MSFSTIAGSNPFTDGAEPHTPWPGSRKFSHQNSMGSHRTSGNLPASQSEPNLASRNTSPPPSIPSFYNAYGQPMSPPASSPEQPKRHKSTKRGREHARNGSKDVIENAEVLQTPKKTAKRSQSPVKRILGKITPKSGSQTSSSPEKAATPNSSSKRSLKQWTHKLRHGFLTAEQEEAEREEQIERYETEAKTSRPEAQPPSTFPISLDPAHQARVQADTELMIVVSANRYFLREAEAGRLAPNTVAEIRRKWESRNMPQVLEYLFDQGTQYELVMANFKTLHFYGNFAKDVIALNSTLHSWKTLAREMSVRTFCAGDSMISKWMHDAGRVLEILGAPLITFLAFRDLEVKTLARITQKQQQRAQLNSVNGHSRNASDGGGGTGMVPRRDWSATSNYGLAHRRNMSDGSYKYSALPAGLEHLNLSPTPTPSPRHSHSVKSRKATPGPGTNSYSSTASGIADVYDQSRGGRLGQMVRQQQLQLDEQLPAKTYQPPRAPHEHGRNHNHYATLPNGPPSAIPPPLQPSRQQFVNYGTAAAHMSSRASFAVATPPPVPPMPQMLHTGGTSGGGPRRRHAVEGEVSLGKGIWSDRQ